MPRRLALVARLALGVLLLAQGLSTWSAPSGLASFLRGHTAWQALPVLGRLQAIEVALIVALVRFGAGVFLVGGFITRGMALLGFATSALLLWLNADGALLNLLALLLAASVLLFGGGGYTLDGVLGRMQRRALERERRREAARQRLHG